MKKVFLVYYDNGMSYEDHYVSVNRVFGSKESAEAYAEEKNAPLREYKAPITKEEYDANNMTQEIGYTYEDYIESDQYDWMMCRDARYYVSEEEVHP